MQVRTILHPTDHSDSSRAALRFAVALAHDYGARLIILHVVTTLAPGATPPGELEPECTPRPAGRVPIEYVLRQGEPVATITSMARERDCDLIVLGRHRDSGWRRLLGLGRAERILRAAHCPVLVVKTPMAPAAQSPDGATEGAEQSPPPVAPPTECTSRADNSTPDRSHWTASA